MGFQKNKTISKLYFIFFLSFLLFTPTCLSELGASQGLSFSPSDVVIWHSLESKSYEDSYTSVKVSLETKENFSIYSSKLKVYPPEGAFFSHFQAPIIETAEDPMTKELTKVYRGGEFTFIFSNLLPHKESQFSFTIEYVGCSSKICLFPYKEKITISNLFIASSLPQEFRQEIDLSGTKEKKITEKTEDNSLLNFTENSFTQKNK